MRSPSGASLQETRWLRADNGDVSSAACGRCGRESVGAGFSNRFFSIHVFPRFASNSIIVAVCDACSRHFDCGDSVYVLSHEGTFAGVVDAIVREND